MKKLILGFALAAMLCGTTTAQVPYAKAVKSNVATLGATTLPTSMVKYLNGTYDPDTDAGTADCYMMFSDKESAEYNKYHGPLVKDGYVLFVDAYTNLIGDIPITLPVGTYTPSSTNEAGTYDPDYTYLAYYDAEGADGATYSVTGNIVVEKSGDELTLKVNVKNGSTVQTITYTGDIILDNAKGQASVFDQIKQNLDLEPTASWNVYDGNLYESNTGAMYLNLYEKGYDPETGGMTEDGFSLALQVFGKLFKDPNACHPDPGTYNVATNFKRYTYFPGTEIDYMGMTGLMGSYVKQRKTVDGTPTYAYSYLNGGTIVIEDLGGGVYSITVDCVTTLGHTVKAKFRGQMPMKNQAAPGDETPISNLEDDVVLDLAQHETCLVWNRGETNNCQVFFVDIGAPSGDYAKEEGDLMRFEMVLPQGTQYIQPGNYTVMDETYDAYYQPFTLGRGRFMNGGSLSSTRYEHFEEGRYRVVDYHAPAASGTVGLEKNGDIYTFNIALMCDANFRIDGKWSGPAKLMYDPEGILAGIAGVENDENGELRTTWVNENTLLVNGVSRIESAEIYNIGGMRERCEADGLTIDMSGLAPGIYVLNINGKTTKIVKR